MERVGFGGSVFVGVEAPLVAAEAREAAVDAKMLLSAWCQMPPTKLGALPCVC